MTTYTVPNPLTAEGLMNIGPAGKSFLVCRGIAGGILTDEAPVIVDRAAMLLWMAWATTENLEAVMEDNELYPEDTLESPQNDDWDASAPVAPGGCNECGGSGRVLDGEGCDGCGGTGLRGTEPPTAAEMRAAGITDPEYIGMTEPERGNPLGYYRGPERPQRNPVPLTGRPYYRAIREWLENVVSDYYEAAHQAAKDRAREPGMWPGGGW